MEAAGRRKIYTRIVALQRHESVGQVELKAEHEEGFQGGIDCQVGPSPFGEGLLRKTHSLRKAEGFGQFG